MTVEKYHWPVHADDELEAVMNVLTSGRTNYWTGPEGTAFEKEFADFIGVQHAVAVMNGTVGLEAALYALEIGNGDEVITSCRTFIASASCIVMRGAIPVLADVDRISQNITPATIEACITPRTKAIIVVHLAGWPAEMDAIVALAAKYGLSIIEDCAQAIGATYKGQAVGTWGDVAVFSFCQDKILTTGGEGGMVVTNNEKIWQTVWSFKDHGKDYKKTYATSHPLGFRWLHEVFGTNFRMTEMQAAIGRIQLKKIPYWLEIRNRNANILNEHFKNIPLLRLTIPSHDIFHAYYKYYVFVRNEHFVEGWDRDRVMKEINQLGIPCFVGSCSDIGLEKAFQNRLLANEKPIAKELGETSLMFLIHPTLTVEEMQRRAEKIVKIFEYAGKQSCLASIN
jgi:dTDP-4-amino-4,6-dideoxygalactose transaminase